MVGDIAFLVCDCGHEWQHEVEEGDFAAFCPFCGKINDLAFAYWDWDDEDGLWFVTEN